jgi:hypothetical protein
MSGGGMDSDLILRLAGTLIAGLLALIGKKISGDMGRVATSVEQLNVKMEAVVTRINNHEKRLDRLEERV